MSAALMGIYWVGIPFGVFYLARWLFRRTQSSIKKGLVVIGTVGFLAWFLWIAAGRNMWLDHQVRVMCAKDGGVKVYETVELTPDLLDWAGRIHIPAKGKAKTEDKYFTEWDTHYYQKGNPEIWRDHIRIIRHNDGKIMGEAVGYSRRGGGLPGPWHPSSFRCPEKWNLESSIFISQEKKP